MDSKVEVGGLEEGQGVYVLGRRVGALGQVMHAMLVEQHFNTSIGTAP